MLICAVVVATELWLGQPWWCSCGSWKVASWDIWSSHNSQHLFDPYSFSHFLHGVIFCLVFRGLLKRSSTSMLFIWAMCLEGLWEIAENTPWIINRYREATISLDYFGDSIANSLVDLCCCALGFLLSERIPRLVAVTMIVVIELSMVFWIRDSLFLNILMLIYPVDAIREWQSFFL